VARTLPHTRTWPQFVERTIAYAVKDVREEINRLNERHFAFDDESLIISSNLRQRHDGLPVSGQMEPADTGIAVYFKLRFAQNGKWRERPCVLSCDKWNKVNYNLTAIAKDINAQRARQRWGCTNVEQAFRGYLAIPERCGGKAWWDELGITPLSSAEQVKDAYHTKAKTAHPDVGGNRDDWDKIQRAYDQGMASFRNL
jgi:hypothetical protein